MNKKKKGMQFTRTAIAVLVFGFCAHNMALANSGGDVQLQDSKKYYIGNSGPNNNVVKVTNPQGAFDYVVAGKSKSDDATGNKLILESTGGNSLKEAFGGYSELGNAKGNTIDIANGTLIENASGKNAYVVGGESKSGSATSNKVSVNGGTVKGEVIGGYSESGTVAGNTVNISSGTITDNTSGEDAYVIGGESESGNADNNIVNISGGNIISEVYGGESESGNAKGNTVNINAGTVTKDVIGGCSESNVATANKVSVNGGTVKGEVIGGYSESGPAAGNSVYISSGTITNYVTGGESESGDVSGNTVHISGGTITEDVCGGLSQTGNTKGNTVIISKASGNNPTFNNVAIYGGWKGEDSSGVAVAADNTLEIKTKGLSDIKEVKGFKNYHFILPADIKAGETVLNAEEIDISNSNITVSIASGGKTALQKGDQITLIKAKALTYINYTKGSIKAQQGVISLDDYTLNANSSTLTVKITSDVSLNP